MKSVKQIATEKSSIEALIEKLIGCKVFDESGDYNYPESRAAVKKFLQELHTTTSSTIRLLTDFGKTRSEVAFIISCRYQHVRNTLEQKLTK